MTQEQVIEAVRNRKTQKLFIVVDDSLEKRYKVINPAGEVIVLPDLLFEEDPLPISGEQVKVEFTSEQLESLAKYQEKMAILAKAAQDRPPPPRPEPERQPAPKPRSASSSRSRSKSDSASSRRGLGAAWNAPRLTFYKHKIEPLAPKQTFKITVEGTGEFEISKEDFLAHFNDVVMSSSYRADGLYSYPKVPDKALRYLKNKG